MCAGSILAARLPRVVFGALDAKGGAVRSLHAMLEDPRHNHTVKVERCMGEQCGGELSAFFQKIRQK